jgi:hypothetical protein
MCLGDDRPQQFAAEALLARTRVHDYLDDTDVTQQEHAGHAENGLAPGDIPFVFLRYPTQLSGAGHDHRQVFAH